MTSRTSVLPARRPRTSRSTRSTRRSRRSAPITRSTPVNEDNCGGADPQCAVQAPRKLATSDGASCIAGPWALGGHDPDRRVGGDSRGDPADLTVVDQRRDHRSRRRRPGQPDVAAGHVPGPDAVARTWSRRSSMVPRARRSTSALVTMPTGPGLPEHVHETPGKRPGAPIGEEVIYDIELPNYDSEAEQIVCGNPDGIVIIDFPETYAKVGPALVRTGSFDPAKTFVTDGLISELAEVGQEAAEGLRGTAPGVARRRHASHRRSTSCTRRPSPRMSTGRRSTRRTSTPSFSATWRRSRPGRPRAPTWLRIAAGRQRAPRASSTPGSSCRRRSRRCRTATTSTTSVLPARSTSTRTATRPSASTTSTCSRAARSSP